MSSLIYPTSLDIICMLYSSAMG
uniref:Uncharacterized protein n=1 Tax=Arundo donax TaxID=35708 RepID=A0A0A9HNW8_ARUDO